MAKYASKVIEQAKKWLGKNENDGSFKVIIDTYNSHKPLARGYKMPYNVAWCATFVSAVSVKLGYTDIIPTECGCERMIELFKKIGSWVENENRTPKPGDIIFYDWDDNGSGDNKGWSDHVGIVEKVSGGKITVIEGNYSNAVKRRTIAVNAKYIRGYGVPKYDTEKANTAPTTQKKPVAVKKAYTGTFPALPARGYFKNGDKGVQVKNLQKFLNWYGNYKLVVDGEIGVLTLSAVGKFQKAEKLVVDKLFGTKSLAKAKTIKK